MAPQIKSVGNIPTSPSRLGTGAERHATIMAVVYDAPGGVVSAVPISSGSPSAIHLSPAFPNPFNPATTGMKPDNGRPVACTSTSMCRVGRRWLGK